MLTLYNVHIDATQPLSKTRQKEMWEDNIVTVAASGAITLLFFINIT